MTEAEVDRPRLRRSSDEIRGLLHAAATTFFARNGYAGTSTRAIATEAGVSETLLFRHFGTKSGLFEATTLERLRTGVDQFLARWERNHRRGDAGIGTEAHAREFLADLLRFTRDQRGVMFAIITVDAAEDEDIVTIQDTALATFQKLLAAVQRHVLTDADGELFPGVKPELTASAVAACVMCVTVLDDWLFREGICQPGVAEIDQEVIDYVLDGVGHRGEHGEPPT